MPKNPKKPSATGTIIGWTVTFALTSPIAFFYGAGHILNNTSIGKNGENIFDYASLVGPGIGVGILLAFVAFDIKNRFLAAFGALHQVVPGSETGNDTEAKHVAVEQREPRHSARAREKELKKLRAANWLELHARHDKLMLEWSKYETDIGLMIDYPIMTDYTDPVIHKVVVAMQKIRTAKMKLEEDSGMDPLDSSLNEAVNEFEASFQAAERYARRYGQSQLDPREQRKLSMARSALNIILDGESPSFEVEAAYKSLRSSLKGIIDVPDKALVEIEALVRREIVAS
jgi:hypothetical protein